LTEQSPIQAHTPTYFKLLAAAGLSLGLPLPGLLSQIPALARAMPWIGQALGNGPESALLSNEPLKMLMNEYLNTKGLMKGLPLYVSVYESRGGLKDLLRCAVAETGLADTPPSKFLQVQSLPEHDQRQALLASAAIPLLYEAQQLDNTRYTDGGQGGWQKAQGNTPITPLIEAGCAQVIVTHLTDGSLWSRHDFPGTTVLEIRPQSPLAPDNSMLGAVNAALGFDPSNISRLMEQGFLDTMHCIGRVQKATQAREGLRHSQQAVADSRLRGAPADAALADALARLR
jgi:NTE family protein